MTNYLFKILYTKIFDTYKDFKLELETFKIMKMRFYLHVKLCSMVRKSIKKQLKSLYLFSND